MKRTALSRSRPLRRAKAILAARPQRNKYSALSCLYNGRSYHSRMEADYARCLDSLRMARDPAERVVDWKPQVNIALAVNGQTICTYICDFLVTFADRREEYHEVKGFDTPTWRIKEKLFRALYPERVLKVIR